MTCGTDLSKLWARLSRVLAALWRGFKYLLTD